MGEESSVREEACQLSCRIIDKIGMNLQSDAEELIVCHEILNCKSIAKC